MKQGQASANGQGGLVIVSFWGPNGEPIAGHRLTIETSAALRKQMEDAERVAMEHRRLRRMEERSGYRQTTFTDGRSDRPAGISGPG